MAVVGSAYVIIRAITEKLEGDISAALNGISKDSGKAGSASGKSFSEGFANEVKKSTDGKDIIPDIGLDARSAGQHAGDEYGHGVTDAIKRATPNMEAAGGGAGDRVGRAFANGFKRQDAGRHFTSMALRIAVLVPVLGAIVAGLSTLVSGLFAVAAAAAQATAALVVLPGVLGAIIQGAGAMLVAFGGVGKAVSAGLKPATQTAAARAKEQIGLQRRLRDAHEAVGDAAYNAAQSLAAAQERVLDADRAVIASHQNVKAAEEQLAAARKAAREELIDLQFAAEGGALAEERAKMTLEQALANLAKVRDLPVDNKLRRDAELSYKEADLNLRMIKERNGDIVEEQKKAKKEGINGQQVVIDAQKNLKAAHEGVRDAIDAQREAQEALSRTQIQNARSMRDANEALSDAQQAVADFDAGKAAGGVDQFATAMKNLSPEARSFVKYIISLHKEFLSLRAAAGRELFPKLEESLGRLVHGFFPELRTALQGAGSAMGDAANRISKAMVRGPFTEAFASVAENNNDVIRRMGRVFANLAIAFVNVMDAAKPLINEFTRWMVDWSERVKVFSVAGNRSGEMADAFEKAGNRAKLLIRITKNIVEGIRDFGKIAAPEGTRLLKVFEKVTERFANFTDTKKNRQELRTFFEDVGRNFESLSTLLAELSKAFLRLGSIKGVDTTSRALLTTVPLLEDALGGTIDKLGPQLVDVINAIIAAFNGFSQSGGLEIALGIFEDFFNILAAIMNGPAGPVIGKLLGFLAALKAIQIIRGFPGISLLDKAMVGLGKSAGTAISNIKVNNLGVTLGQTIKTNLAAAKLVAVQGAKNIATSIGSNIKEGAKLAGSATKDLASSIKSRLSSAGSAGATAGRNVGTKLADALKTTGGAIKSGTLNALGSLRSGLSRVGTLAADAGRSIGTKLAAGARGAGGALGKAAAGLGTLAANTGRVALNAAKATGAFVAQKGAMIASATATKIAAGAQWLLNAAMAANPIVLIIAAIVALIAIFVIAYKKSEAFRDIVNGALREVGEFFSTTFEGLKAIVTAVWNYITFEIKVALAIIKGLFTGDFGDLAKIAKDVFNKILGIIRNIFGDKVADAVKRVVLNIVNWFRELPGRISKAAGNIFKFFYDLWSDLQKYIRERLAELVGFFKNLPDRFRAAGGNMFKFIYDLWRDLQQWIRERLSDLVGFFRGLPGRMASLPNPFNFLLDTFRGVLKGLQDLWNSLDLSMDLKIPDWVPKYGGATLSIPDIFPDIHAFASGGTVTATSGGVMGILAEAGRNERIEPLDSSGLSVRDRAIIDLMISRANLSGSGDHIEVHPSPGMDEVELADLVLRKKRFNRRLGK